MERRTVLKLVVLGGFVPAMIASGQEEESAGKGGDAGKNQLQFFTEEENKMLDQLMEMIIPRDGHSPGAHGAKVSLFADSMIVISSDEVKQQWRRGLQLMREEAERSNLQQALEKSAAHEDAPSNELEHFFVRLKAMTVQGYYTSSIGIHEDLEYQGNAYVESFPGCATGVPS